MRAKTIPLLLLILSGAAVASESGPRAGVDADRTGALPEARHEREMIARCGLEWAEIKRSGAAADLTWRRFWESCRQR